MSDLSVLYVVAAVVLGAVAVWAAVVLVVAKDAPPPGAAPHLTLADGESAAPPTEQPDPANRSTP
jgi:hypothetical protein